MSKLRQRSVQPQRATLGRWAAWLFLASIVVFIAVSLYLFVWPRTDTPARADAIVVFGGRTQPERLALAVRLMNERVAPVLVITAPPEEGVACGEDARFEVVCVEPDPFTTRGDARAAAKLAGQRGWRSLVLVTSTWHVRRARMLLERCYGGRVEAVGARPEDTWTEVADDVAHEWGGLLYAAIVARDC